MGRRNEDVERPDAGEQPDVERQTVTEPARVDEEEAGVEQTPRDPDEDEIEE